MRAMVVYESMFGNTQEVAHAIALALGKRAAVDIFEVGSAPTNIGGEVDLLLIGAPTHAFSLSRESTRENAATQAADIVSSRTGVREWLDALRISSPNTWVAAFGTVLATPRWVRTLGTAAGVIERRLRALGLEPAAEPGQFLVEGVTGPLSEDEEARAAAWVDRIVDRLTAQSRAQVPMPEHAARR